MDPNTMLNEMRRLVRIIQDDVETVRTLYTDPNHSQSATEFAQLFDAMDEWLSKGGYLPRDWQPDGLGRAIERAERDLLKQGICPLDGKCVRGAQT